MSPNEFSAAAAEPYLHSSEDATEFARLRRELDETHQPADVHERILVENFAHAWWELLRARRIDSQFWEYVGGHHGRGETGIAEALAQEKETRFRTALRLRTQAERSYYRALAALDRMHRDRAERVRSSFTSVCRNVDASLFPGSSSNALSRAAIARSAWPRRPSMSPIRV